MWSIWLRRLGQILCMRARFHAEESLWKRGKKMNSNDILRFSLQLSMLRKLYNHELLTHDEYIQIEKRLSSDYNIYTYLTI